MRIGKNKVVAIDYTLTNPKGDVLDSSKGKEPLSYLHGAGGIIPGLEQALEGKSAGEDVTATIPPEQAYGTRNEQLVAAVSRKNFGDIKHIRPGMQFQAQTQGGPRVVTVVGVEGDEIRVDANHPLAGETLKFDVKVVNVRDATPDEISHGHAHGPGGHHHH